MNYVSEKFFKEQTNRNSLLGMYMKNDYILSASIIPNLKDFHNADTRPEQSYIFNAYINKLIEITNTAKITGLLSMGVNCG